MIDLTLRKFAVKMHSVNDTSYGGVAYESFLQFSNTLLFGPNRWIMLFLFSLSFVYLWCKYPSNYPPGPRCLPFIGYIDFFKSKSHIRLTNLKDMFGDIFSLQAGSNRIIVVCSLQGIFEGLAINQEIFSGRPNFKTSNVLFFGDRHKGISTADPSEKTYIKRKFVEESLDVYCSKDSYLEDHIAEEAMNLICYFIQQNEEFGCFDPAECFKFAHLHVMLLLVFNEKYSPDDDMLDVIFECLDARLTTNKRQLCNFFPFLKSFSREHFNEVTKNSKFLLRHQRCLLNHHKDTYNPNIMRDMADHLLSFIENDEDRGYISTDEMDYLLLSLMGSGFGAVPSLLTWLIGYMVSFPEVQAQVQKEMDDVIGRDRFPTLSDQPYLPFMTAVILEVQRIVTIYPFLLPHRNLKPCVFQGYDIPKNTLMLFNVWSVHHDSRYWKNPMKFNPDRFLDDDKKLSIPDHFLPYGMGERRCPGESLVEVETFIFFSFLLHQLTFSPGVKNQYPNLEADYDYILCPKPFQISLQARE